MRERELLQELAELQSKFTLCDKTDENRLRGKRIAEIKKELINLGVIRKIEPRKNRRKSINVNR